MKHAVAVDASVAAKWVLEEEFSDRARALLATSLRSHRPLIGPPHLLSEVVNVLYQRLRTRDIRRHITESEAEQALAQFLHYPLRIIAPAEIYTQAFAFARQHHLENIYDSLYVVLAQREEVELWTDDRTLLRSTASVAPWVRWIADYPLPP